VEGLDRLTDVRLNLAMALGVVSFGSYDISLGVVQIEQINFQIRTCIRRYSTRRSQS
jgi:hypothetical protein